MDHLLIRTISSTDWSSVCTASYLAIRTNIGTFHLATFHESVVQLYVSEISILYPYLNVALDVLVFLHSNKLNLEIN